MSAQHTPGPWWGGTKDSPWYVRRESDDACIAHMEDGGHCDPDIILIGDDEREANARLIAAAPDYAAAANEAIVALAGAIAVLGDVANLSHAKGLLEAARAKARGQ